MADLRDTRLPGTPKCPYCANPSDGAMAGPLNPTAQPADGDVTVCIRCVGTAVYVLRAGRFSLRKPTAEEAADLVKDAQLAKVKAAIIAASRHPERGWELR